MSDLAIITKQIEKNVKCILLENDYGFVVDIDWELIKNSSNVYNLTTISIDEHIPYQSLFKVIVWYSETLQDYCFEINRLYSVKMSVN